MHSETNETEQGVKAKTAASLFVVTVIVTLMAFASGIYHLSAMGGWFLFVYSFFLIAKVKPVARFSGGWSIEVIHAVTTTGVACGAIIGVLSAMNIF